MTIVYVGAGDCTGDIFLKGNYIEVGIAHGGSFGSANAPSGFAGSGSRLGFNADALQNGWAHYTGDYFMNGRFLEGKQYI